MKWNVMILVESRDQKSSLRDKVALGLLMGLRPMRNMPKRIRVRVAYHLLERGAF